MLHCCSHTSCLSWSCFEVVNNTLQQLALFLSLPQLSSFNFISFWAPGKELEQATEPATVNALDFPFHERMNTCMGIPVSRVRFLYGIIESSELKLNQKTAQAGYGKERQD